MNVNLYSFKMLNPIKFHIINFLSYSSPSDQLAKSFFKLEEKKNEMGKF